MKCQQEVLGRTDLLLSFDMIRPACKRPSATILPLLGVFIAVVRFLRAVA
jgi:hypothetical protein